MTETQGNDYVATAAAEKRLREILAVRLPHHTEQLVDELAATLLADTQIEYKSRAKAVVITIALPDKATVKPKRTPIPDEKCWCGGPVGRRDPGDEIGLGCLENIAHNWQAASAESQAIIESEYADEPPIVNQNGDPMYGETISPPVVTPGIRPFVPVPEPEEGYDDGPEFRSA